VGTSGDPARTHPRGVGYAGECTKAGRQMAARRAVVEFRGTAEL